MKSIIESLNVRLNSPLIISFLISWPFWNWEIMVGLMWYDSTTLAKYVGVDNYFDFIKSYSSWKNSFCRPLTSAIVYTFLFPLIRWGITAFNTMITTKEEAQALKISQKGFIPTLKYVESYNKSQEHIKELSEIIEKESEKLKEIDVLKVEKSQLNVKVNQAQNELKRRENHLDLLKKYTEVRFLNGTWHLNFEVTNSAGPVDFKMRIVDGSIPPELEPQSNFQFRIEGVDEFFIAEYGKAVIEFSLSKNVQIDQSERHGEKMFGERTYIDAERVLHSFLGAPIVCRYIPEDSLFYFRDKDLKFTMQKVE